MNPSSEHIAAIQALGYTADEARFLYLVATFSGYFVPRQFLAFTNTHWGKRSDRLSAKLQSRGHASWRDYPRAGGAYHLYSKTLYRIIDKEPSRHRRRHSIEFIRTRLLLLDFVLANPAYQYLETEADKVTYFCESLHVPRTSLPSKVYQRSSPNGSTVRYFVDKFPLFLDAGKGSAPGRLTFSYVDASAATLAGFAHHLAAYKELFSKLADFDFLYISDSPAHFSAAEKRFGAFADRNLREGLSSELLRYFTLRYRWDEKQYGTLSNPEIEWLEAASARFAGPDAERLYAAWRAGEQTDAALSRSFPVAERARCVCFRPWLLATGRVDDNSDRSG